MPSVNSALFEHRANIISFLSCNTEECTFLFSFFRCRSSRKDWIISQIARISGQVCWSKMPFPFHCTSFVNSASVILNAFGFCFPIKDAELETMVMYPFHQLEISLPGSLQIVLCPSEANKISVASMHWFSIY